MTLKSTEKRYRAISGDRNHYPLPLAADHSMDNGETSSVVPPDLYFRTASPVSLMEVTLAKYQSSGELLIPEGIYITVLLR